MKTILTTIFAIALMVFAFNANPVIANEKCGEGYEKKRTGIWSAYCAPIQTSQMYEFNDLDQDGNERDIAYSGEEGSTAAAGANEQQPSLLTNKLMEIINDYFRI